MVHRPLTAPVIALAVLALAWPGQVVLLRTASPPPTHNFARTPTVTTGPYDYDAETGACVAQDGTVCA